MADEFSGIERLLGLPTGSTKDIGPEKAGEVIGKKVVKKTTQLTKDLKKIDTLQEMSSADLVKCGLTVETLEQDKLSIRNESFEVYRIAKALLTKYHNDVKDMVDVNDRMYLAGGKLIDSVTGSLDKLTNMILKFKQEEEMRKLTDMGEEEDGKKEMNPTQWIDFVEEVKKDKPPENKNVQDAEIVDE